MVDAVSIVIAVVSLLGSLVAAGFAGWISFYVDKLKRRADAKALIHKYRDPLTKAAYDLQSRLFGLVQQGLLRYVEDEHKTDLVYCYTAFLVGQYLSWVYILRRQAQFVRFSTDNKNKQLSQLLDSITAEFSKDSRQGEDPFMLWRGQQMAIGELMSGAAEKGELYCMGYAVFESKYHDDPKFKKWFEPIELGISALVAARAQSNAIANYRLRRLQHLLIDLVMLLDEERVTTGQVTGQYKQLKVDAAHECKCDKCPGMTEVQSISVSPISKLPEP